MAGNNCNYYSFGVLLMADLTYRGGVSMPLVCYVSERDINTPLDAERLLRLLGVSGKLSGLSLI